MGANGEDPPPVVPDHSQDVRVMCTKKDFSAAQVDPPGTAKLFTPFPGATGDYPTVLNSDGKQVLMCMSVFQSKDEAENKSSAQIFCKSMGYPGVEKEFMTPVEVTETFRSNSQLL